MIDSVLVLLNYVYCYQEMRRLILLLVFLFCYIIYFVIKKWEDWSDYECSCFAIFCILLSRNEKIDSVISVLVLLNFVYYYQEMRRLVVLLVFLFC